MIIFLLFAVIFVGLGEASNVVPHIPMFMKNPKTTPITLRDPIHPGTVVWIAAQFNDGQYNNDIKIYVIAGGNGEFNDQMKACVLEIRAYHDDDRITYGSLSKWGGTWNYAADSKNSIHGSFDFVLEFKEENIVVWVNDQIMSIYPYSETIHDISEITGIHLPENSDLMIWTANYIPAREYGSFPYHATFDPPLAAEKQFFVSQGLLHCSDYAQKSVSFTFHNGSEHFEINNHFAISYSCAAQQFEMISMWDAKYGVWLHKDYEASKLKNGMVLHIAVDAEHVEVQMNGDALFDYPQQVDIGKYPVTNFAITSFTSERYPLSFLAILDDPSN